MTGAGALLVTTVLAAPPTPPPGKGAEWGKAAPIGLLIIVLLGVALYLLIKSMNRHMRKVAAVSSFDASDEPPSSAAGSPDARPSQDDASDAGPPPTGPRA